jgi:hypothetical protein
MRIGMEGQRVGREHRGSRVKRVINLANTTQEGGETKIHKKKTLKRKRKPKKNKLDTKPSVRTRFSAGTVRAAAGKTIMRLSCNTCPILCPAQERLERCMVRRKTITALSPSKHLLLLIPSR